MLSVVAPGVPGDFNLDDTVDAADYVVRRKIDGTQSAHDTWQANFGEPGGGGSGACAIATAPEPATLVLLMFAAAGCCMRGSQSAQRISKLVNA